MASAAMRSLPIATNIEILLLQQLSHVLLLLLMLVLLLRARAPPHETTSRAYLTTIHQHTTHQHSPRRPRLFLRLPTQPQRYSRCRCFALPHATSCCANHQATKQMNASSLHCKPTTGSRSLDIPTRKAHRFLSHGACLLYPFNPSINPFELILSAFPYTLSPPLLISRIGFALRSKPRQSMN